MGIGPVRIGSPPRIEDAGEILKQLAAAPTEDAKRHLLLDIYNRSRGFGGKKGLTLQDARERVRRLHVELQNGKDPLDEKQRPVERAMAFKEAAEQFIATHEDGWKNDKHRSQWRNTLAEYAYPALGKLDVTAIDDALINQTLAGIWKDKPETASRVAQRIKRVIGWVKAGMPRPAVSKANRVKHHAALPYVEIAAFMRELRGRDLISAKALELTILTATRTGEVIGARWDEIDLDAKIWTVPASRMKSNRAHRVPLTDRVVTLLEKLPREDGGWLFPGTSDGKPLSNMAMLKLIKGMRPELTVHGFRSAFRDWAFEQTAYPKEIAEAALAHVVGDKVEAAYRRGDALEKRRSLMTAWAAYCERPIVAVGDNVVAIGAGAA